MRELKECSENEFNGFLKLYQNRLDRDFFMESWTWNDFSIAEKWPDSIVAMRTMGYNDPDTFKILKNGALNN